MLHASRTELAAKDPGIGPLTDDMLSLSPPCVYDSKDEWSSAEVDVTVCQCGEVW